MSFNRKCVVDFMAQERPTVAQFTQLKRLEGIDVKFNIDLPMSAIICDADISLCNLTRSDIDYLTSFTNVAESLQKRHRIRLYAGYDDSNYGMIFDGDVFYAVPTAPPDIWLNIKARSGNYETTQVFTQSVLLPSTTQSIFEHAAQNLGKEFEWRSASKKVVKKWSFTGNIDKYLQSLSGLDDTYIFIENDKLIAVDKVAPVRDGIVRLISEKTGMIGVPKIDFVGIEATLLLDTRIRRGDTVKMESVRVPSANGVYYVYNITHTGHLRGNDFFTTVKARREDTYGHQPLAVV